VTAGGKHFFLAKNLGLIEAFAAAPIEASATHALRRISRLLNIYRAFPRFSSQREE
jgi:hypothetical protein